MNLEDIRNKYQCDEGRTFAQWKEWVRKNKPSQAQAHIVKAVAPNGSKYERVIGGYTDAQNTAFDLVSHGYKDVKLYHSVNAGPLKLLRNFSAPLHGAKFKDSDVSTDAQDDKKFFFQVFTRNGKLISKIKAPDTISTSIATRLAEQESKKFKKNWYKCQIVDQNGRSYETYYNKVPSYNGTRELAQKNIDSVDEIRQKYAMDAAMGIKISGNEKGTERLTMEKVFKEWLSPAAAWQKVKKGNTIMIRFNGNGPNKKLKGKDVLKIEYFNPNVVAMTPRSGGTQLVGLQRINVMAGKLASEGLRSYPEFENMLLKKDSADDFASDAVDGIRNKYQSDAVGAGVVNPNFKFQTNVEKRLATTRKGRAMTLPQYGKPSKVYVGKDGKFFAVFNTSGQKLSKTPFKTASEAESFARKNGWMVEKR